MAATLTRTEDGIYTRLGVKTYINATGHTTSNGGSLMAPEVLDAMLQAARHYVSLDALQRAAGKRIAEVTGAPAALVSSGAAGSILLAAAGALTGTDRAKIMALPDVADGKNQIVVWGPHSPNYMYQACRAAGGKLVEVGGPGQAMTPELYRAALNEKTAAVLLVHAHVDQALAEARSPEPAGRQTGGWESFVGRVAADAQAAGVPVLVDAASELPPRALIQTLLDLGVAGIIVSGGKAIRGPQATGLLLGRPELIEAAHLNNNPRSAIGRPLKVGKEEISGLVVAVERFFAMDEAAQLAGWRHACEVIARAADGRRGVQAEVSEGHPDIGRPPIVSKAVLRFPEGGAQAAVTLAAQLEQGDPGIHALRRGETLVFNPMAVEPGEPEIIARRLRECLG